MFLEFTCYFTCNLKNMQLKPAPVLLAFFEVFESQLVNKNFVFTSSTPTLKAPFLSHSLYSFPVGTYNGVHQSEKKWVTQSFIYSCKKIMLLIVTWTRFHFIRLWKSWAWNVLSRLDDKGTERNSGLPGGYCLI